MKRLFQLICLSLLISCTNPTQPTTNQLLVIDKEFSNFSIRMGFNKAFIEFAHTDAVLLRENRHPIVGKQAIVNIYENLDSTGIHFSWEPLSGNIAQSGELGYTYGIYTLKNDTTIEKGTYVSIWKKDENGVWKYILDTGNEGLGN